MSTHDEYALTDEDIRKLKDASTRKGETLISVVECGKIRTRFRDGRRLVELAQQFDVTDCAVRRHLSGGCECKTEAPPIKTTGGSPWNRIHCWSENCRFTSQTYNQLTDHYYKHHRGGD